MTDTATLKKSLLMIQKLKKLVQEQNEKLFDPIAITGMSCRLPQTKNLHEFWQLLYQGKNIIRRLPDERWELLQETQEPAQREPDLAYWGGYLQDIDAFDAYFFGISPREALRMDPQQRLLLEVSYEAFEDAGLTTDFLTGSNTGVFSSLYASQFSHLQTLDSDMDALLIPTGSAISMAANRLSYLFDLHGPSLVLDTACSSSLIAIQLACLNLQARLCDQALVSAIHINLLPSVHSILSKATMLSPTGQCRTFDAQADGYVQGEGAGAIVLKPLKNALADKDRIYAVIAGSAVNQDGRTNGLTAPNGLQQEQLLRTAYRTAKIDPAAVSYIECHGTGTFLGDPIEAQALGEVMGKNRDPQKPCWISSVKTNVGHLEPAAGIISIIKTALILKNGQIPPHLNFIQVNPHIPLTQYNLSIPDTVHSLPRYGEVAVAGVSGFGFGGANAHIVLRETSLSEQFVPSQPLSREQELFTLSAKDAAALNQLIQLWRDFLKNHPEISLALLCYNLHLRRSHYAHRLAIKTHSLEDLYQKLTVLNSEKQTSIENVFINNEPKKNQKPLKIAEFDALDLTDLAKHYINHALIDWQKYEADRFYPVMTMPFYPWQHKKYWPILGKKISTTTALTHPLCGHALSSPLPVRQFEFIFEAQKLPEIKDTFYVAHAGYYLEMLAYAANHLPQTPRFTVEALDFLSPLVVSEHKILPVQLIIQETLSFTFYSNNGANNWVEHAKGTLSSLAKETSSIKKLLLKQSKHSGTADAFYQRITDMNMPAGATVRWIRNYWINNNELFAELRLPKLEERGRQFIMNTHPGIIDACVQTLFLLLPARLNQPYVASHMSKIEFYGSFAEPSFIYASLKELAAGGEKIIGDWYLLDKNQQVLVKCADLCLTQLGKGMEINKMMEMQAAFHLDFSLPYAECKKKLIEELTKQIGLIFSMPPADINIHHSLDELGMDSLMAMAIIRIIETNLGVVYSLPAMMQGPSIHEIAEHILADKTADCPRGIPELKQGTTLWIAHRKARKNPHVRLFCFPYGGGGASIYREWQHEFPDSIEVCPIQLPGRENRLAETPIDHMDTLISLLAQHLQPCFDLPFAFFGHSFGSLIAFELSRYLRRHHLAQPTHLFASAYPDPRKPSRSLDNLLEKLKQNHLDLFALNQESIGRLDDRQLTALSQIFSENGIVDYSDERMNKSIIQVLLPIFIGDMNSVKSYIYRDEPPLQLNATVFLGQQDSWVTPEDLTGWEDHFAGSCTFHSFDQGHLFIREKAVRTEIIRIISAYLKE